MLLPLKWNILVDPKNMKNAKHATSSLKKSSRAVVLRSHSLRAEGLPLMYALYFGGT